MKKVKKQPESRKYVRACKNFSVAVIIYLLSSLRINQAQAGAYLGLSRSAVNLIKQGKRNITVKNLIRCADKLGMSLPELVLQIIPQRGLSRENRAFRDAMKKSVASGPHGRRP